MIKSNKVFGGEGHTKINPHKKVNDALKTAYEQTNKTVSFTAFCQTSKLAHDIKASGGELPQGQKFSL